MQWDVLRDNMVRQSASDVKTGMTLINQCAEYGDVLNGFERGRKSLRYVD